MTADYHKSVIGSKMLLIISALILCLVHASSTAVEDSTKPSTKKSVVIKTSGISMATSASNMKPKIMKIGRPRQFWSDQLQIETQQQQNRNNYQAYQQHSPSGGKSMQGFGLSTLMAVSLVSALFGAMTYSVLDGRGRGTGVIFSNPPGRSFTEGMYSALNLIDPEAVMKILSSVDWSDDLGVSSTFNSINNTASIPISRRGRITREPKKESSGVLLKWYQAYRKDPVDMRCVHKLICENLASTSCAAKSVNPEFDATVLNMLKLALGSVGVSEIITETVGNPRLCKEIYIPYDLCASKDDGSNDSGIISPENPSSSVPQFNLTSIVPRVKYT